MARRSKADALLTREHILDAAGKVFVECGVAKSSLQKVAAEAGVTCGAIYWHFKDKSDLLAAVVSRGLQPWRIGGCQSPTALNENPLKAAVDLAVGALTRLQMSSHMQQMCQLVWQLQDEAYVGGYPRLQKTTGAAEFVERIRQRIELAAQQGLVPEDLAVDVASLGLFVLVDGLMREWVKCPSSFNLPLAGRFVVSAYINGLCFQPHFT